MANGNREPYHDFVARLFAPPELARKNAQGGFAPDLPYVLYAGILAGRIVDALKRDIFYGDKVAYEGRVMCDDSGIMYEGAPCGASPVLHDALEELADHEIQVLHACLGLFGEAAELLEPLRQRLVEDSPLDLGNLTEEAGDAGFYLQALRNTLNALGQPDAEVENRRKLEKRYSEGAFSEAQAQARADKKEGNPTTEDLLGEMMTVEDVCQRTTLSRATLYRRIKAGLFPKPRRVGRREVRWTEHQVQSWIEEKIRDARGGGA